VLDRARAERPRRRPRESRPSRSPNEHPNFPEGGKMSQHLDSLAVGDTIEVKGPVGHFVYEGRGTYSLNGKKGERRCACAPRGARCGRPAG
jgi:hypothetical protein